MGGFFDIVSDQGDILVVGVAAEGRGIAIDQNAEINSIGTGPGAARIALTGTTTGSSQDAVTLSHFNSDLETVDGLITLDGTSTNGIGVNIGADFDVIAAGTADVEIFGNGSTEGVRLGNGAGTGDVLLNSGGLTITTDDEAVLLAGSIVEVSSDVLDVTASTFRHGGSSTSDSFTVTGNVTVQSGSTFGGIGTVSGTVTVEPGGAFAPGNSPGIVQTGDFNLQSGSTLQFEFGGPTAGNTSDDHDQVQVTGSVTLSGSATFDQVNEFEPTLGQVFTLLTNDGGDSVVGMFDGLPEGTVLPNFLGSGVDAAITYIGGDGNDVQIVMAERFVVTTSADTGIGSLRQVLTDANSNFGPEVIEFDISTLEGAGPHTISPTTPLPTITDAVTFDGFTEAGASANSLLIGNNAVYQVILDGTALDGTAAYAFDVNAPLRHHSWSAHPGLWGSFRWGIGFGFGPGGQPDDCR